MYLYITKIRQLHDWSYFEACLLHLSRMSLIFKNRQEAHFVSRIDVNPLFQIISIKNSYTLIARYVINYMKKYHKQGCTFYNVLLCIKCSCVSYV